MKQNEIYACIQRGITDKNIEALLNAVVMQAAEDYRHAWLTLLKREDPTAERLLQETEEFFLSEDFAVYTKVSGSYLLRQLEKERREGEKLILSERSKK